jgi:hypothetical protein
VTRSQGIEKSQAIEIKKFDNGWSLDLGLTKTQGFAGVSKDIIKTEKLELDVGAGVTTKKQGFAGIHIRF